MLQLCGGRAVIVYGGWLVIKRERVGCLEQMGINIAFSYEQKRFVILNTKLQYYSSTQRFYSVSVIDSTLS